MNTLSVTDQGTRVPHQKHPRSGRGAFPRAGGCRPSLAIAALVALATHLPCASAQEDKPETEEDARYLQSRGYRAPIFEEDPFLPFRAYLSPSYDRFRDARGWLTDGLEGQLTDKVKIDGRLETRETFDSNVFLSPSDEVSDAISSFIAAIQAKFEDRHIRTQVNFVGRERVFADNSRFNGLESSLDGKIRYVADRVSLELWDTFADQKDPIDTLLLRDRLDIRQNSSGANLRIDWNHCDVELSGMFRSHDVLDDVYDFYDYARWEISLVAAVDIVVKAQGYLEVGTSSTDFDLDVLDSFASSWILGGIRGRLSEKLAYSAQGGAVLVDVDEDSGTVDRRDRRQFMARAGMGWRISVPSLLFVSLQREPVESVITGSVLRTRFSLSYSHWLAERFVARLGIGFEKAEEEADEGHRTEYVVAGGLRYELGRDFFVDVSGLARLGRNETTSYSYDVLQGSVGIGCEW